jgi:hypothetical protein
MDEPSFWAVVQQVHDQAQGDMEQKCEVIGTTLAELPSEEARQFAHLFDAMMDRAYSWPLWGAAYVINGGCGDDTFSDFRASLISRGRDAFERAIADPDSLALEDVDEEAWCFEGYQYAVTDGVEAAVGSVVRRKQPSPDEPSGEPWDEDEVHELYPRFSERFK